jgi:mRNA-degrading endonuclease YafQ of YafQ-DinJ toxin-antitoxin module
MRVALAEAFQRDVRALSETHRLAVFDAMLSLPRALGDPHAHAGLGIRKLHASGIWEARVGLGLRLVFALEANLLTLVRVGSHDDIRRYLTGQSLGK